MKKMSQIQHIDQYIKDFGSITILDAVRDLGIMNFTARISNMREQGYPLVGTWEESKNRYGEKVRYMRYTYGDKESTTADTYRSGHTEASSPISSV